MANQLSVGNIMVFEHRTKYQHYSNFKTPISGGILMNAQTQFSFTFLCDQEKPKHISNKFETTHSCTAELKLVQEWRSMNKTKNVGIDELNNYPNNFDTEVLEPYPFSEEPVTFHFGDDYGNQLFVDLQQEFLIYQSENINGLSNYGRRGNVVESMKYSSSDIYFLSTERMGTDISLSLPRVLIVSRRSVRKNKFVDFVGEYHLDLIVRYGAVPVIVPRVTGVHMLLDSFEPIHGVLLCEGEDIDPSLYESETSNLSSEELEEIRTLHASDTAIDKEKDKIELRLAKLCLERKIPYLGICRGSQVLNVACGGTLYRDIGKELADKVPESQRVLHMDYENYDVHRHPVRILENTPLYEWFRDSLEENGKMEIWVNSYHHQGVKRLAQRFVPMAFAPDGLIEGFYDPDAYNPEEGKFIMGLQFHPERMRRLDSDEFDYPGCPFEFVKAVITYQKKLNSFTSMPKSLKLDGEMEKKRRIIIRSFSLARNIYEEGHGLNSCRESEHEAGAEFLESNTALSQQQETRLKQMGATVRNASCYLERLKLNEEREKLAWNLMGKMSVEKLSDLLSFYHMMGHICSEVLERKIHGIVNELTPLDL
ncbi:hypothetical protein DH2020_015947 [Rehmannia glutinosa]|uniref:Uncharacterized protein n=1 Tax=Rehmannia glutinosa TaxID=99300 RepID=A0ABR0WXT2_REHGL